jgi:serine protease Do
VIRAVEGETIADSKMLQNIISHFRPGDKVRITLLRQGQEKNFNVELMKFPERVASAKKVQKEKNLLGLVVGGIPEPLAQQGVTGVIVKEIESDGPAAEAGLAVGDLILEIDMQEVTSVEDFQRVVSKLEKGKWVSFYVRRGDQILYRALKIPADE